MTATPPPPPPGSPAGSPVPPPPPLRPHEAEEKAHVVAWLVPVAAVLAVIGVFTPWFKLQATGTVNGQTRSADAVEDALYSWKEGKLGLVAPIVLVLLAIGVVSLMRGGSDTRFHRGSSSPVANAAKGALIAGVVAVASVVVTYFLLPSQYTISFRGTDYSWDEYEQAIRRQTGVSNIELSQGPQIGFWLTGVAGVLAIVAGGLMLVLRSKQPTAPSGQIPTATAPAYGPPQGDPQAPGYGTPPAQQPAQPPAPPPAPPQY